MSLLGLRNGPNRKLVLGLLGSLSYGLTNLWLNCFPVRRRV